MEQQRSIRQIIWLGLVLICAAALPVAAQHAVGKGAPELKVVFHSGLTAPYALIDGTKLTGGLVMDVGNYVASAVGIKVSYIYVPAPRIDNQMEDRQVNVRPFMSPVWTATPGEYLWSVPLLVEQKAFLVLKGSSFHIRDLDDIKGLRIGTIFGFQYPELDQMQGIFTRDDVESLKQNLERLAAGRINAVYDSELYMLYLLKDRPDAPFIIEPFRPAPVPMMWAFSKDAGLPFDKIDAVMKRMVQDKVIEKMARSYRP